MCAILNMSEISIFFVTHIWYFKTRVKQKIASHDENFFQPQKKRYNPPFFFDFLIYTCLLRVSTSKTWRYFVSLFCCFFELLLCNFFQVILRFYCCETWLKRSLKDIHEFKMNANKIYLDEQTKIVAATYLPSIFLS